MKMQKKINIVLVILIVVLVSLVSFGGIYLKNKNEVVNILPNYILGTELQGYRQVTLAVKEEKTSTENDSDGQNTKEGNENAEENKEEKEEETPKYSVDDYKKAANIYTSRFKSLKVDNFSVTCDEDTGKIVITLPENDQTDIILSDITQIGEFTIKDSNSQEVLLNNDDVSNVKIGTQESATGTKTYMSINFNGKGTNKFKKVTKDYQNVVSENTTATVNETQTEEETDKQENAVEDNNENKTEQEENNKTKQVTINVDSTTILTTDFSEVIDNGVLSLSLGNATSSDGSSKDELYSAYNLGAIIENNSLPVEYEVQGNSYISALIDNNKLKSIVCIEIGLALIVALAMVIKYRVKGLLTSIISIGLVAILLIVIRYANVVLSLEGLFAIGICYILSCVYGVLVCKCKNDIKNDREKSKAFKNIMKKYTVISMSILIVAIVCSFTQWSQLTSFGMIIFWGVLISWIYNNLIEKLID